jgi:hypothetical protein
MKDNVQYLGEAGLPKGDVGEYFGDEGEAWAGAKTNFDLED